MSFEKYIMMHMLVPRLRSIFC